MGCHAEFAHASSQDAQHPGDFAHLLAQGAKTVLPLRHLEMSSRLSPPGEKLELDKDLLEALTLVFQSPDDFNRILNSKTSEWEARKRGNQ